MKNFLIFVLLFTLSFALTTSNNERCQKKVTQLREKFSSSNSAQALKIVRKIFGKLSQSHPNVETKKIYDFMNVLIKQEEEPIKVCALFQSTFVDAKDDGHVVVRKDSVIQCLFGCLSERLSWQEVFRILGKCINVDDPLACFVSEAGEHVITCVSRCLNQPQQESSFVKEDPTEAPNPKCIERIIKGRAYYNSLDDETKREMVKKLYAGLAEKFPLIPEAIVAQYINALLFSDDAAEVVCALYRKIFGSEPVKPTCSESVEKARTRFAGLDREGKRDYIRKLYAGLVKQYPDRSRRAVGVFIKKFLFSEIPADKICALYQKLFLDPVPTCQEKVGNVREVYNNLDDENKEKLEKKITAVLGKRFPKVEEKQVNYFVGALLKGSEKYTPKIICRIFKYIFKSTDKQRCAYRVRKGRKAYENFNIVRRANFVVRMINGLKKKFPKASPKKIAAYVKIYISEKVKAGKVCQLYRLFFEPRRSDKCTKRVWKARKKLRKLSLEETAQFILKFNEKLTKKYENATEEQIVRFITAFISRKVKGSRVCKMYKNTFNERRVKCLKKVRTQRKKYENLTDEEKSEMRRKISEVLAKKFPDVSKRDIWAWIRAFVSKDVGAGKICSQFRKTFKPRRAKCVSIVSKAREEWKGLNAEEKKEFLRKLYAGLVKKWPNVSKRTIGGYIRAFLSDNVEPSKACALYRKISKQNRNGQKCATKVTKTREHFNGLDDKEKKAFITKLYQGLVKQYPDASRRSIAGFIKILVGDKVEAPKVCLLYKRIFLNVGGKPPCGEKVKKVRTYFEGLDADAKKEFLKKIFTRLVKKFPNVSRRRVGGFIKVLVGNKVPVEKVCKLFHIIFRRNGGDRPRPGVECAKKINKTRAHFATLDKKAKKKFVKKIYDALKKKYPNVSKKVVGKFVKTLLLSTTAPKEICSLYRQTFSSECAKKVIASRKKYRAMEIAEKKAFVIKLFKGLNAKFPSVSRKDIAEFIKAFLFKPVQAENVCKLFKETFTNKCTVSVINTRTHFASLKKKEKKKFVHDFVKALYKKHSNVSKKQAQEFVKVFLFSSASPLEVCYKKDQLLSKK